ncbi:class I SAM-dependent methyltransferase [Nocardia gipuzkoensis]
MDWTSDDREALLYDWHNDHLLRDQRQDIDYWLTLTSGASRLTVLGAGTGRVAAPLARYRPRTVAALDLSIARLQRMPSVRGLTPIRGDIRNLPMSRGFDAVVVPYSTLQLLSSDHDRQRALSEADRVLVPGGYLYVDVSSSFDTRTTTDWHIKLCARCPALGGDVQEWERCRQMPDHVVLQKRFQTDDGIVIAEVEERWAFLDSLDLASALDRAGFDVTRVDQGYGGTTSSHRRIYHARRRA